eukprot:3079655-Alexandrium_andersonii.AAC.1
MARVANSSPAYPVDPALLLGRLPAALLAAVPLCDLRSRRGGIGRAGLLHDLGLSLIHISEPTRLALI